MVFKALLVTGLIIGVAVLVIAGVRRARAHRGDPNWSQRPGEQPGHVASLRGVMPNTPLPQLFDSDDDDPDLDDGRHH